jgi:hypothetical protein
MLNDNNRNGSTDNVGDLVIDLALITGATTSACRARHAQDLMVTREYNLECSVDMRRRADCKLSGI